MPLDERIIPGGQCIDLGLLLKGGRLLFGIDAAKPAQMIVIDGGLDNDPLPPLGTSYDEVCGAARVFA